MRYGLLTMVLFAMLASTLHADEGALSSAKRNKLGLSSMQVAPDQAGLAVRGKFYYSVTYTIRATDGTPTSNTVTYGTPLTNSPPPPLPVVVTNSASGSATVGNLTRSGSTSFRFVISNTPPISPILPTTTFISPF